MQFYKKNTFIHFNNKRLGCLLCCSTFVFLPLQLSKVFHAISNSDSVYRTSMENLIKVIDGMNKRVSNVEKSKSEKRPTAIDFELIKHLNISVEELERKNKEISESIDQTNYGLLQLGGQLNTARTQEVSSLELQKFIHFSNHYINI